MSENEWLDIFADNLRDYIKESGLSQYELSEKTKISQTTISRYLNKQQMPSVKAVLNLSYALECDLYELIDFGEVIG